MRKMSTNRTIFQSTLPRGSDFCFQREKCVPFNFNPRSLAGATSSSALCVCCIQFQSTLPRGSDGFGVVIMTTSENFNPRSLAGATDIYDGDYTVHSISIHAPSRERLSRTPERLGIKAFQSTLPRGSDGNSVTLRFDINISIHAPSRERHKLLLLLVTKLTISIHAPSRERPSDWRCY